MNRATRLFLLLLSPQLALAQLSYPYVINALAGTYPLGNGGPATSALLQFPNAVAIDANGNMYIADGNVNGIRKVSANGTIASFSNIYALDLKVDSAGNLYAVDGYATAYKISPSGTSTVIAGGTQGFAGDGGPATSAKLNTPSGIALDTQGNIYIADTDNCRIRKVTTDGKIQTIAGTGTCNYSNDNIFATGAALAFPTSVAVDTADNVYISEYYRIRKVTFTTGVITTLADSNGLPPTSESMGLAVDNSGNLYVADSEYSLILQIAITTDTIQTIAGTNRYGFSGDSGPAASAQLDYPVGVALDASGSIYVVDQNNDRIRKIASNGVIGTVAGRTPFGGDGGPASAAIMSFPTQAIADTAGNIYFSDSYNHRVRKISTSGTVSTIAGTGACNYTGNNGPAVSATLCAPSGLAFDSSGNLYIADSYNSVIRRIDSLGKITTFAGTGNYADAGDNGPASSASFEFPYGLVFDGSGNLYVSDSDANRVRKINSGGTITAFAGTGKYGSTGDGGLATAALLNTPQFLAADSSGNIYIADEYNYRVRKVTGGIMSTAAGLETCCGTGTNAANTFIGSPGGLAVDAAGELFISFPFENQVGKVSATGAYSVIAGTGKVGSSGDAGLAVEAAMEEPAGLWVDASGLVYLADAANCRIRTLTPDTPAAFAIQAGDGQTAATGAALANPLTVAVTFRAGVGVAALPVTFAVTSGSATLSVTTSYTDATGTAGVALTMGSTPGPVVVTATFAGFSPVQFHLTATAPTTGPTIVSGGVDGAGGSVPAIAQISPGGLATIYGSNFAPAGTSQQVQASDLVNGVLPTSLAGTCVQIGSQMAFITYVSPGQINFQVPTVPVNTSVSVQVITGCGGASPVMSNAVSVPVLAATPEFLYWVKNANGQNPVIAVNAQTYAYVGAPGLIPSLTFVPAKAGDVLTIYGISFGPTNPAVAPGAAPSAIAPSVGTPVVTLGSTTLDPASVLYAGVSPGTAGLYQLNIVVPPGLASGNYPLALTLGTFSTPAGGYLTVQGN
jgi:uncharacterized protein (TIGR03437 family)